MTAPEVSQSSCLHFETSVTRLELGTGANLVMCRTR